MSIFDEPLSIIKAKYSYVDHNVQNRANQRIFSLDRLIEDE